MIGYPKRLEYSSILESFHIIKIADQINNKVKQQKNGKDTCPLNPRTSHDLLMDHLKLLSVQQNPYHHSDLWNRLHTPQVPAKQKKSSTQCQSTDCPKYWGIKQIHKHLRLHSDPVQKRLKHEAAARINFYI